MQTVSTPNAPAALGPYSQAKIAGGFVFASGQIAIDPAVGKIVETTIEGQTRQVLANVEALLEAAGTDLAHVVKTTCFLAHIEDFAAFNAIYAERFGDARPARSAVGVAGLPAGALVEVEVIAEL
jgi:2-iminobutanoate/2-iminopropanoate deaminase